MESFTNDLNVKNKDNLRDVWRDRTLRKLRKHIYNFMLERTKESEFFDLDDFNRKYVKNITVTDEFVNIVVIELNNLDWKTHIGFGGTGLYIYSSEDLPSGVY